MDCASQTLEWDDYDFPTWTEEQKLTLDDHINYHKQILSTLNEMKESGPSDQKKLPKLPSAPKRKLKDLYETKGKKTKKTRTPEDLHEYLKSKIVDPRLKVRREVFFFKLDEIQTPTDAILKLKEGYKQIERRQATSIFFYVQYGSLLDATFNVFKAENSKKHGKDKKQWTEWIKETEIGIRESWDRKLREMFHLLEPYKSKCLHLWTFML